MIILYRILTYILAPFALLFGLLGLAFFLMALANPGLLLGVFMLAAFIIYVICSFRFLHFGLIYKERLKAKLRDWIRVNAYVALPFGILIFMNSATVIGNPGLLSESIKQMAEMQGKMNLPVQSGAAYTTVLLAVIYVMLFFALVLLVHIMLTFSFMKKYEGLFEPKE